MQISRTRYRLSLVAATLMSGSALAHHSFAAFDMDKTIVLNGTVRTLEWTNPHA